MIENSKGLVFDVKQWKIRAAAPGDDLDDEESGDEE